MKEQRVENGCMTSGSERNLSLNKPQAVSGNAVILEIKPSRKLSETSTKFRQTEYKSTTNEERYFQLVDNADCIIIRRTKDGQITFFNKFAQKFFGYTEREIIGKNIVGTIVPETDSFGRDLVKMIRDIGRQTELYATNENENICKNGRRVWVSWTNKAFLDKQGNVTEILCLGHDITKRKKMENELRLLAAIVENSPDPITVQDFEGNIIFWNQGAEKVYGYSEEEALKMNISKIIPEHKREQIAVIIENLKKGENIEFIDTQRLAKDGRMLDVSLAVMIVKDEAGKPFAIATNEKDITEHKILDKEILFVIERERKLLSREIHDSIGQVLAGISVKSKGLELDLKSKSVEESKDAQKISILANKAIAELRGLVKTLHPVDVETGGIVSALHHLASTTRKLMGASCTFKYDKSVILDNAMEAKQLYRIAQEAITNALKHGRANSISIELNSGKDNYVLSIKNNGKDFPKVLTKKDGMGLKIMKHRAGLIGGLLEVSRGARGGTIVRCIFPKQTPVS